MFPERGSKMRREMSTHNKIAYLAVFSMFVVGVTYAKNDGKFSLPDSILLFGGPGNYGIVMPGATEVLAIPVNPGGHKGPTAFPSLDTRATLVSSGFPVANDDTKRWKVRCAVAVYSRSDKHWQTYGDFSQVHITAISPDRLKVAFIADETDSGSRELLLLDVGSGQISKLAKILAISVSWSSDGKRLVLGIPGGDIAPQIEIFDVESRKMYELVKGQFPAWSPTGNGLLISIPRRRKFIWCILTEQTTAS